MRFFSLIKHNRGQTSVEYIMMVIVIVTVITSVFGIVKKNLIGDGKDCATARKKTFYCEFKQTYEFNDFKTFQVRR